MTARHVVVLSGGLDSTCALALALQEAEGRTSHVRTISFDYGQRHARELLSANEIAVRMGVAHGTVSLQSLLHGSALLHSGDVPDGRYDAPSMSATVVHGRNLLFASAAIANAGPGAQLWFGVHAGDHPIYPDCRPVFWERLTALAAEAYQVTVRTPFLTVSKAQALALGHAAGAPVELSWSCYKGQERQCGRCGTCVERAEAFDLAGIPDPTDYADPGYWRHALMTTPAGEVTP